MNDLLTRALSGLIYSTIIIITLFITKEWFFIVFFILGCLTIYEYLKLVNIKSFIPYILLALLFLAFNLYAVKPYSLIFFLLPSLLINGILIYDLFTVKTIFAPPTLKKKQQKRRYACVIFYLISGFVFLTQIAFIDKNFTPKILVGIFILVWANDTFAYLVGKNFGKHKLMPLVSPKKTIEGFIGGIIGTIIISFIIFTFTQIYSMLIWIILACIVAIFGTVGDLVQSKFKRQAGVKDSGTIMPGHGGLYDRLDSMLFASPFVYSFLEIINYVS